MANFFSAATIFVALLSAAFALAGILAQIDSQNEAQRVDRLRQLQSARAFLPSALSSYCEVARMGVRHSYSLGPDLSAISEQTQTETIRDLTPSDEIVSVLRDVLRFTDDNAVSERISLILREHQIFLARWRGSFSEYHVVDVSDGRQRTVSWAYLYALIGSLFEYARGEADTLVDDWSDQRVITALSICLPIGAFSDDFEEEIGLYSRHFFRRTT